jgi:glutamate-1-semialdehyde 2,1-aminomutase
VSGGVPTKTPSTTPRTAAEATLLETAARRLPGGVLGSSRFADDIAFVVKRAQGSHLWDVSGREYIDYLLGSGPMFLGHGHPAVTRAVTEQLASGSTYFLVNEPAIALADEVCRAVPCGEQIRFTSTGQEATFFALRAARAFRKRDKILKFEGGYHGSHDYALMSQTPKSPKAFPAPMPDSGGIPHAIQDQVLVAPYNDLATVEALIAEHGHELAAVIVEPFQRLIPPLPGFLAGLRAITHRQQIPLIFDEVVTGFRFAYGGAQEYYGVTPDLAAYGKIIGGKTSCGASTRAWTAPPTTSRSRARSTATRSPRWLGWPRWPSCASPASTSGCGPSAEASWPVSPTW